MPVLALLASARLGFCAPPQHLKTAAKKTEDAFLQGSPFSLEDLLRLLKGVKDDLLDESRIEAAIQKRGLDLTTTPDNLESLRAAGASGELLQFILKIVPPPPAPRPVASPTGTLSANCSPPECRVRVNGGSYHSTEAGKLHLDTLPAGKIFVDFDKDGYLSRQESVAIAAAGESRLSVVLDPDDETKAKFGRAVLNSLLGAVGAQNGRLGDYSFSATGSASLWDTAGALSEWDISLKFGPPDLAVLHVRAASGELILLCRGEKCQPKSGRLFGGKQIKGTEAAEIATNLRSFRRYFLPVLLDQFTAKGIRVSAVGIKPPGGTDQRLHMESNGETYEMVLDSQLLPANILYSSGTGLGSGLQIAYADYVRIGELRYPRHTQIRLPDAKQHGLLVRLSEITAGADLRERDFPTK